MIFMDQLCFFIHQNEKLKIILNYKRALMSDESNPSELRDCHTVINDNPTTPDRSLQSSGEEIKTLDDTLKHWRKRGLKIAFIYDFVLDKYQQRLDLFTLVSFILTALSTLSALSNLGLNDCDYPNLSIVMKAIAATLSLGAAIFTGIIRVKGWTYLINDYLKYSDKVEHFLAELISELTLPRNVRSSSEEFVMRNKDKFLMLLSNAPNISHDDYLKANKAYEESRVRLRNDLIQILVC